ncbi:hypothetical protein ACI797_08285 [Geodermatophilus sp. SYSU D00691]
MSEPASWHVDAETSAGYRDGSLTDATTAASVETHLLQCAGCRIALATGAPAAALQRHDRGWAALTVAIDGEPATVAERVLGRVLPLHLVRLLAAAPALRRAWWVAGTGLLAFALTVSFIGDGAAGTAVFVVTAPLLPLAGVALAYAAVDDVAGEVSGTTPYSRFRLLLLRTAAVAAATLPVAGLLAWALPVEGRPAGLWLAPALALCALTLALSARRDPRRVAAVLTALWLAASWTALLPVRAPLPVAEALERSLAFRPPGQVALLCVAAVALAVAVTRRTDFEDWSRR